MNDEEYWRERLLVLEELVQFISAIISEYIPETTFKIDNLLQRYQNIVTELENKRYTY